MFVGFADNTLLHSIYTDPIIPIDWKQ